MSIAERYDRWLHNRLFNPFFTWLQKWLHWNRFQIIYGFLACMYAAGVMIGLTYVSVAFFDRSIPGIAGLRTMIGTSVLLFVGMTVLVKEAKRTFQDLKKASERFEETGQSRVSHFLYTKIVQEREARIGRNVSATLASVFLSLNAWMYPFLDTRTGCILVVGLFIAWTTLAHLWDVDGVKLEDRANLFEPQPDTV